MKAEKSLFRMRIAAWTLVVGASIAPLYAQGGKVQAGGLPPQERMAPFARKLNLGAARSDSASPVATASGAVKGRTGYYQCFERGCVYYAPGTGMFAVQGGVFSRFVQEGAERASLGFPTSNELRCTQPAGVTYQLFEGGRVLFNASARTAARTPLPGSGDPADCRGNESYSAVTTVTGTLATSPELATAVPVKPEQATIRKGPAAKPQAGRFRVTLNGFLVGHETADHALEVDGKRDEVYLLAEIAEFNSAGEVLNRTSPQSVVMGDIQGQDTPPRIPAGRASSLGGLRSSDQFPETEPWRRTAAPSSRRPPMLLWEGTLTQGVNAVIIVPTIWEWDGPTDLLMQYRNGMASVFARYVRTLSADERAFSNFLTPLTGGPGTSRPVGFEPSGNAADRPIGVNVRAGAFNAASEDGQGREWFTPQRMLLTYSLAQQAAANTTDGFGPGIFKITYRDAAELAGNYTLYVQVERVE